jgi:NADH-quinone oxidoreductase subunit J
MLRFYLARMSKYKVWLWLIPPLLLLYGLGISFVMHGEITLKLTALFCAGWDFTLDMGIAAAALGLATGVILVRSPITALFCLIGVFVNAILLLLTLRVEFLSMILLIVYIGAIAILFLFVIMLLNLSEPQTALPAWNPSTLLWIGLAAALSFPGYHFLVNGCYLNAYYNQAAFAGLTGTGLSAVKHTDYYLRYGLNDVTIFSDFLYTSYAPLFLLSSMVLLAAMMGAIVLAMSTLELPPQQNKF